MSALLFSSLYSTLRFFCPVVFARRFCAQMGCCLRLSRGGLSLAHETNGFG
jgi:hypothetical protein